MRRVTAILSVAAVVLMVAGLVAQSKPSFAGEWKIVADPDSGGGRGEPGIDLTITQSATAMNVEYRAGGQAPAPVKLTYKLDGSVSKNIDGRPRRRRADRAGFQGDVGCQQTRRDHHGGCR
jgi:hypothetical protein